MKKKTTAINYYYNYSVENEPASLLVVPLIEALSGIPPFWCGRQKATTPKRARYSALIAFS